MRKNSVWSGIIACLLIMVMLCGCGLGKSEKEPAQEPNVTAEPVPVEPAATAEPTPEPTAAPTATPAPTLWETLEATGELRVAICPDYAPYEFRDAEDTVIGSDVVLAKTIAEGLGLQLVLVETDAFEAVFTAIEEGEADLAISAIADTPERRERFEVSVPYGIAAIPETDDAAETEEPAAETEEPAAETEEPAAETEQSAAEDAAAESGEEKTAGGMVILGNAADRSLMDRVDALVGAVNAEGVYAGWLDDAVMTADGMGLLS